MKFAVPLLLMLFSCSHKKDLSDLLAPPTEEEKQTVLANWSKRDVSVKAWKVLTSQKWESYQVEVVSQSVNGKVHYSLIRYPLNYTTTKKYALLMVNHGGIKGCSINILHPYTDSVYDDYFIAVPSYIGEPLDTKALGLGILESEGDKSFFDKDVDNVIALLNGLLATHANIDPQHLSICGDSRGACVAYITAIRDARYSKGFFCYGSTDHFTYPGLNELVYSRHKNDVLPWIARLTAITDYNDGNISREEARLKLLQKSPIHFAAYLPKSIEIHHGAKDKVVYVENSRRISAILNQDSTMQYFHYFEYPNGGHGSQMPEIKERKQEFFKLKYLSK